MGFRSVPYCAVCHYIVSSAKYTKQSIHLNTSTTVVKSEIDSLAQIADTARGRVSLRVSEGTDYSSCQRGTGTGYLRPVRISFYSTTRAHGEEEGPDRRWIMDLIGARTATVQLNERGGEALEVGRGYRSMSIEIL